MKTQLYKIIILFFLFISGAKYSSAQNKSVIDSLKECLHKNLPDTDMVNTFEVLFVNHIFTMPDTAFYYAQKELELAQKKNWKKGVAIANNNLGHYYYTQGDYSRSLSHLLNSLKIREKMNDQQGSARSMGNIGNVYIIQGNYPKALEYNFKALKIAKEYDYKVLHANTLGNIGLIYWHQKEHDKALEYDFKALKMFEDMGNKRGVAIGIGNIGNIYYDQDNLPKALEYYLKALKIDEEMGENIGVTRHLGNIGTIYLKQGDLSKALECNTRALKIATEFGYKDLRSNALANLGGTYTQMGEFKKAEYFLDSALVLSSQSGALLSQIACHKSFIHLYDTIGNCNLAYQHFKTYSALKDTIFNEEKSKDIGKLEAKAEYDKQFAVQQVEKEKQDAITKADSKRQKVIIYAVSIGMLLLLIFAFFIANRLKITRKQKNVIEGQKLLVEEKNKEITDSISYAKRIQTAILPPQKLVKEYLEDSFIFYLPKDIVAGDFYWLEHKGGEVLFAAADCTGHGVPGAMVSVICNNGLNRSVREHELTDPGKILDKTREIVVQEFAKSEEDVKDGMDISLCSLSLSSVNSKDKSILKWAGANNPLWIMRKGELLEWKANKQPIGKVDNPQPFTTHTVELQQGDAIYIFTDGYVDQFGGEKGKKFKSRAFRELLFSIQDKSMEEQKVVIADSFETWRGDLEQIDDVCVIGIKI